MNNKSSDNSEKKLISLKTAKDIQEFLEEPTVAISEFLTGVLSSGISEYKLSTGRLVQSAIKLRLFTQLGREIKEYQEKGKIKEDYFATNKAQASLLELLQFIDSDIPDEEVFRAMKSIFFTAVSTDATEKEEAMAYQLLQVCKKLTSLEVLILKTCYEIFLENDPKYQAMGGYDEWEVTVSIRIGYELPELIGASDVKLREMGLLTPRNFSDQSGIRKGKEFRLTRLSLKLCEYINNFDKGD